MRLQETIIETQKAQTVYPVDPPHTAPGGSLQKKSSKERKKERNPAIVKKGTKKE